ncbi:MAG: diguanylate cyclase [Candidatus Omnitrophota bacterium]
MKDNKRILLALNDKDLIQPLQATIKSWGYEIVLVKNGKEAFNELTICHPYAIIVDDTLEDMDGFNLSKTLKEDFLTAHIPIIMLIDKKQARKKMLEIEQGVDDYLIKPPDPIDLELRIELAKRSGDYQFFANSLTRLPGSPAVEKNVSIRIQSNQLFSFFYIDIDNFKSFNDKYGYVYGDSVIMQTARIISMAVKKLGSKNDFVGHIGGDDFVAIVNPDNEKMIAKYVIEEFDRLIPFHYAPKDRREGFIIVKDRSGEVKKIPLMSISIAIVNNKRKQIANFLELTEIAFEIKKYLKTLKGSNMLINRRHEEHLNENNDILAKRVEAESDFVKGLLLKRTKPLGQRLLDAKLIDETSLNAALVKHWATGRLLGEVIVDLGIVSQERLDNFLVEVNKARSEK